MVNSVLRGGKTSLRLLKDLQYYNPQLIERGGDNVLTQLPPPFDERDVYAHRYPKGSCQHDWAIKEKQSALLRGELVLGQSCAVAACCARCRSHIVVHILAALDGDDDGSNWPCTGLHHFVHDRDDSPGLSFKGVPHGDQWEDLEAFRCRKPGCTVRLKIAMGSPRLSDRDVAILTDKELINERASKAVAGDPERFEGISIPSPLQVLGNLRTYILDSLSNSSPRKIAANNKRWLVSLGDECRETLGGLHFTRLAEHWMPPQPEVDAPVPFENPENIFLDNVATELSILIAAQPTHEQRQSQITAGLGPAQGEMATLLNCREYRKMTLSRRMEDATYDDEHPWYACLGAVMDFHDDLLKEAYQMQIRIDEPNQPYYFDCLQGIAQGRESVELQTEVALQESKGVVGISTIEDAYRTFSFDMNQWSLNDEMLIGNFLARVTDSSRAQEHELRRALEIIGKHRGSQRIMEYISNGRRHGSKREV